MNGIKTIQDIKDRCFVNDEGQWIWRYATNGKNTPVCKCFGRVMTATRAAYCIANKVDPDSIKGLRVWSTKKNSLDVNPANLMTGTPAEANKFFAKKGNPKSVLAGLRRRKMFDRCQITEIRESLLTAEQEADSRGCSAELIRQIRGNKIYKTVATNASVFAWRPA
ncbi:MAG: hypothetical protein ACM3VZ_11475 [Acidobacteriota bacterium]